MAYSLAEQLTAVEIYRQSGTGQLTGDVLEDIRATLGKKVSRPTVRAWIQKHGSSEKENFQPEKKVENLPLQKIVSQRLAVKCEQVAQAYMDHALQPDVIKKTTGPAAMTAAGIAIDKRQKLLDLPVEVIVIISDLVDELNARNISPGDAFALMLQEIAASDCNSAT